MSWLWFRHALGRDSDQLGGNAWKQWYHLVSVSLKIWQKQLHQAAQISEEPGIQLWLHQPFQHQWDGFCSCAFIAWCKTKPQPWVIGPAIPYRAHNVVCAFCRIFMHWLPSNLGCWQSRFLLWVSSGGQFYCFSAGVSVLSWALHAWAAFSQIISDSMWAMHGETVTM